MGILDKLTRKKPEASAPKSDMPPVLSDAELRVFNTMTIRRNDLKADVDDLNTHIQTLENNKAAVNITYDTQISEAKNLRTVTSDEMNQIDSILSKMETIDLIDVERKRNREEFLSKRALEKK